MNDQPRELHFSLLACLALGGVYIVYEAAAAPDGGHPFGHVLGIIGMLMMMATETLYSLRKRTSLFGHRGPVRYWLSAHIFMGIVGPFLVLMHSAFEFRGLAGITMGLTALVVASGFLGRYLYTAIPRSLAGVEETAAELQAEAVAVQQALERLAHERSAAVAALVQAEAAAPVADRGSGLDVLLRGWEEWRDRRRLHARIRQLERTEKSHLDDVERMLARGRRLERQRSGLETVHRLMSVWHVAHVPMGMALFTAAFIHVAVELYFRAGLLR